MGAGGMYPAGPLLEAIMEVVRSRGLPFPSKASFRDTDALYAHIFGVSARQVYRWESGASVRVKALTVDRVCTNLGLHPCQLYASWLEDSELAVAAWRHRARLTVVADDPCGVWYSRPKAGEVANAPGGEFVVRYCTRQRFHGGAHNDRAQQVGMVA